MKQEKVEEQKGDMLNEICEPFMNEESKKELAANNVVNPYIDNLGPSSSGDYDQN